MFLVIRRRNDQVVGYDLDTVDVAKCFLFCIISLADEIPKGIRRKRFLPHGVLNVQRYDDSSLSFTYQ